MAYQVIYLKDITELKSRRGSPTTPICATILGVNYPVDENFVVYVWDESSTTTPDDYEYVGSNLGSPSFGRWCRIDNSEKPQINADWNAVSGPSQILNKPALLKGDKGDVGPQGVQGSQGVQGVAGPQGLQGPKGDKGDTGNQGVQGIQGPQGLTGASGSTGATGAKGDAGEQGIQGIAGVNSFGAPSSKTVSKATAYQAGNNTKPAVVTITLTSTSSFSLSGTVANAASIVIGTTSNVASGTGTVIAKYNNTLGGGLTVGLNVTNTATNTYTINLPAGWYYAVVQTTGTGVAIDSVFEQVVG